MRLKDYELKAIRTLFQKHFGLKDHIYLFGSRVDDTKKGGDIDLYVQTQEVDIKRLLDQKMAFLLALEEKIGEQKIDVVLHRIKQNEDLPIYKIAREEGVLLL